MLLPLVLTLGPVYGPLVLGMLIAWYLVYGLGLDLWGLARWVWRWLMRLIKDGRGRSRDRRTATPRRSYSARTASGQRRADGFADTDRARRDLRGGSDALPAGSLAKPTTWRDHLTRATRAAGWWAAIRAADATAAARASRHRTKQRRDQIRSCGGTPPRDWWAWPHDDEPEAPRPPVKAQATRTDRDPAAPAPPALPQSPQTPPTLRPPLTRRLQALDYDIPVGPLTADQQAALPAGRNTMTTALTSGSAQVAESGLFAFTQHAETMTAVCNNAAGKIESDAASIDTAINSARATVSSITSEQWDGVPVSAYNNAIDALASAQTQLAGVAEAFRRASDQFANALSSFQQAAAMAEQHRAAEAAGTRPGSHDSLVH